MYEETLPPDLAELESRLQAHRPPADAPAELRRRVLCEVAANLASTPRAEISAGYYAGLAAAVLIGLSLSTVASSVTRFGVQVRLEPAQIADTSNAIRELAPSLTAREADQLALSAAAGSRGLSLLPDLHASPAQLAAQGAEQ